MARQHKLTASDLGALCAVAYEIWPRSEPRITDRSTTLTLTDPISMDRVVLKTREAWDAFRKLHERMGPAERSAARDRLLSRQIARFG